MKTNMLILAFVFCASAMTVLAQVPSQQPPLRDTTSVQSSESYLKGMTTIKASEIPSSLRTTLQAPEYISKMSHFSFTSCKSLQIIMCYCLQR